MQKKDLILITGCDSGIGRSLADILKDKHHLAITYLNENNFENYENIHSYKLDLKNEKNITDFTNKVKDLCKNKYKLHSIINNSGIAFGGPIENIPLSLLRDVFEVNFFGLISLTQKLIPEIIKSKGRIITIGSMAGRIALPFLSPYVSTKFALEGFNDSLRREMNPFGVKTILIEPGGIATPIWTKAKNQDISFADNKYLESLKEFEKNFINQSNNAMLPGECAGEIVKIIYKKNPKPRYIISNNNFLTKIPLLLPSRLLDKIFIKMFKMHYR